MPQMWESLDYLMHSAQAHESDRASFPPVCHGRRLPKVCGAHHGSSSHSGKPSQVSELQRVTTVLGHRCLHGLEWSRENPGYAKRKLLSQVTHHVSFILRHFRCHFSLISAQFLLENVKKKNLPHCIRHTCAASFSEVGSTMPGLCRDGLQEAAKFYPPEASVQVSGCSHDFETQMTCHAAGYFLGSGFPGGS